MPNVSTIQETRVALVVDDSKMQCRVLQVFLEEEGYRVITANDGAEAVDMYIRHKPDLVLMDINMPVMNGYEATLKIKSLSSDALCPLIFITSDDTEKAFIESVKVGGDGILVRPFSPEVFKAKIQSIQRIINLYGKVKALQQEQQKDAELAEQLMSGVIEARNFALDKIGIVKKPAALFSGDIQLTALCPNGNLNVMLGDFTGHGLRSSIGAIPLAETFRAMTRKGFSLIDIISQINKQLYDLLPTDLFLGAVFVTVSEHDKSAYIFNGGLPDAYILSGAGEIKFKVSSSHPPMGVLPNLLPDTSLTIFPVNGTDRIALISDGIIEARNIEGEMFEFDRFERSLIKGVQENSVSKTVLKDVMEFCQDMPQEDDISLIDIPCSNWNETKNVKDSGELILDEKTVPEEALTESLSAWDWQLKLSGSRLGKINPIPMALNQITEIEGQSEHWQNLFTILTELFVNSLDHGVLGLNSDLKSSAEGFVLYFHERESRLSKLTDGFVDIKLSFHPLPNGGRIKIVVKDSGKGFDVEQYRDQLKTRDTRNQLSGRGIYLLEQLCETLVYKNNGTLVEVTYAW
ncbi:ATP-binding SpoIIE family protein phosphatase [Pseudocolwellia sp. HL-MZ19]|uniref:ATP-binding SpoIIE family protein phosphatase n=1 Tax=unclassified Pseudocolwellia TaxID=2848178 RepID=UPI003CF0F287